MVDRIKPTGTVRRTGRRCEAVDRQGVGGATMNRTCLRLTVVGRFYVTYGAAYALLGAVVCGLFS